MKGRPLQDDSVRSAWGVRRVYSTLVSVPGVTALSLQLQASRPLRPSPVDDTAQLTQQSSREALHGHRTRRTLRGPLRSPCSSRPLGPCAHLQWGTTAQLTQQSSRARGTLRGPPADAQGACLEDSHLRTRALKLPSSTGSREDLNMANFGNMSLNNTGAGGTNVTGMGNSATASPNGFITAAIFILLISLLGIIGNSLVFWYLGFRIKRTKYTVYILNLAVADLIYLICISIMMCITLVLFFDPKHKIANPRKVLDVLEYFLDFGNAADMFLLTAISVERCLSVFYPFWYRCNRPKLQSVVVCSLLWGLSGLVTLVDNLVCPQEIFEKISERCTGDQIFLSVLIFVITIPIMVSSSLILVIKIQRTTKKGQPPKLFVVIVISVIIFLISVAPVRLLWLLLYLQILPSSFSAAAFFFASYLCVSINSSANPFIYFLVGRHNITGVCEYLERALRKVFREEEEEETKVGCGMTKANEEGDTTDSNISFQT